MITDKEKQIEELALNIYDKIEMYPDKGVSIRIAGHLYELGYRLLPNLLEKNGG